MTFPKTAFLIPSFNRETTIGPLLDSLLASEGGIEMVSAVYVFDDCSKDNTVNTARAAWKSQVPLKVIARPKNLGERANVNGAMHQLAEENVEWVFMIYSDDLVKPAWLREVTTRISCCSQKVATICTSWDTLSENKITSRGENDQITAFHVIEGNAASVRDTLIRGCWWHISCCAIRMKSYQEIGDFEPLLRHNGDWEWLLKCLKAGWAVEYIPRALHYYRQHKQSVSSHSHKTNQDSLDKYFVIKKYAQFLSAKDLAYVHALDIYFLMRRTVRSLFNADLPRILVNIKTAILCIKNFLGTLSGRARSE